MGYKLLGFLVWKGTRIYLSRRFGPRAGAKALAAGGALALAGAVLVVGARRLTSGE
jgi:hypothetical protein